MPHPNFEEYIGKSLSDCRVEQWFEVEFDTDPGKSEHREYFRSLDLAIAIGEGAGVQKRNLRPSSVLVITKDGKHGIIVSRGGGAALRNEEEAIKQVREKYKAPTMSEATLRVLGVKL
jgi:hypothetical protein